MGTRHKSHIYSEHHNFNFVLLLLLTFSYFSFSFAAFCSYGCLSLADCSDHISPNFFAVSPIDKPGCSFFIFGRCSEQKRKNADLHEETMIEVKHQTIKMNTFFSVGEGVIETLTVVF